MAALPADTIFRGTRVLKIRTLQMSESMSELVLVAFWGRVRGSHTSGEPPRGLARNALVCYLHMSVCEKQHARGISGVGALADCLQKQIPPQPRAQNYRAKQQRSAPCLCLKEGALRDQNQDQPATTHAAGAGSTQKHANATRGPDTRLRATSSLTQWVLLLGDGRHPDGWHAGVRAQQH